MTTTKQMATTHDDILRILEVAFPNQAKTPEYECLPFVSLDIETTGTDPENSMILQIAAIFHDGKYNRKKEEMPFFNFKIWVDLNNTTLQGSYYAMNVMDKNKSMIEEMYKLSYKEVKEQSYANNKLKTLKERNTGWVLADDAPKLILEFLENCKEETDKYYAQLGERPQGISFCGKNFAGFDLPFIKAQLGKKHYGLGNFLKFKVKHRIQDIGAMFYPFFGFTPGLDSVNKMTNRTEVAHDAYDDAYDCIEANLMVLRVVKTLLENYKSMQKILEIESTT